MNKNKIIQSFYLLFILNFSNLFSENLNKSLCEAIERCKPEEVKELLKKGANPSAKTPEGTPFLSIAIYKGKYNGLPQYTEIVKLLVNKGADVNAKVKENTPLDILIAPMRHGMRPNSETQFARTNYVKELREFLEKRGAKTSPPRKIDKVDLGPISQ